MTLIFDAVHRLEADPAQADLQHGFSAEIADPTWLLGRQWQLGEHLGEDASSPVRVAYRCQLTPINPLTGQPDQDPRTTPAEAIVESEPGDWWTPGRRVATGRRVAAAATATGSPLPDDPSLKLTNLPIPYDRLNGHGYDGRTLWRQRAALNLREAWFGSQQERPPDRDPIDLWDYAELTYNADFQAAEITLRLRRHDGGDLDWHAVDANAPLPPPESLPKATAAYPDRLRYPGAPLPRWWEIEDAKVDIGGYPPDRAHLATVLLIDLIMSHSDDWFTFPVSPATNTGAREPVAGHVLTLHEVQVTDSFGDPWTLEPPTDWALFTTKGLDRRSLIVWATAATPLIGPVLDEVTIGIDEDANLIWAVEQRLHGRDISTDAPPSPPPAQLDASGRQGFAYRPITPIPAHWHPYVVEEVGGRRRFVQGRAADLSGASAVLLRPAESDLLIDPTSGGKHPVHQLKPAAVPTDGVRLERRAILARRTDGTPALWTQRRRQPLLTPPALRLRFDALDPAPPQT